jgi:hypothetical protein
MYFVHLQKCFQVQLIFYGTCLQSADFSSTLVADPEHSTLLTAKQTNEQNPKLAHLSTRHSHDLLP